MIGSRVNICFWTAWAVLGAFSMAVMAVSVFLPTRFPPDVVFPNMERFENTTLSPDGLVIPIMGRTRSTTTATRTIPIKEEAGGRKKGDSKGFNMTTFSSTDAYQAMPTEEPPYSQTNPRSHSYISFLNIANLFTGHSLDESEEAQNDFLAAIRDTGKLEFWIPAASVLAVMALLSDGTPFSCLIACILLFALIFMYTVAMIFWIPLGCSLLYGILIFLNQMYGYVDLTIDFIVKMSSSELEDYYRSKGQV